VGRRNSLLSAAQCPVGERFLTQAVIVAKDVAARLAFEPEHRAGAASERTNGSAHPVRNIRISAGISLSLAARPRTHAHGAGRCGSGSSSGSRDQRAGTGGRHFGEEPSPRLPHHIVVGGTVEESKYSQASVIAVVPVMLLLMFTVLMAQLQSFQRLFLVLSVAPLGLIGVVAALLAVGQAAWFCRHSRHSGVDRNDSQERRDPDRPDRRRACARKGCLAGRNRRQQFTFSPDHADGRGDRSRHDSDRSNRVLGANGLCDHGGLLVATILTLVFLPTSHVAWFERKEQSTDPFAGIGTPKAVQQHSI
jgi:hypothetical protein